MLIQSIARSFRATSNIFRSSYRASHQASHPYLRDETGNSLPNLVENTSQQFSRLIEGPERIRESVQVSKPITGFPDGVTKTVWDVLIRSAELNPNGQLFGETINGKYVYSTYKKAVEEAKIIGSGILSIMEKLNSKNKLIGIAGIQSRNYMHTIHGISGYGMTSVFLYHQSPLEVLCNIIDTCKLEIIFCENATRANGFLSSKTPTRLQSLKTLIILDNSKPDQKNNDVEVMSFEEFKEIGRKNRKNPVKPTPETIYALCHTSGTTGKPKGVEISHGSFLTGVAGVYTSWTKGDKWNFGKNETYLSFRSLFHIYEHLMQTLTIYTGGRIGIFNGNLDALIPQMQKIQPTIVSVVPFFLNKLYEAVHDEVAKKGIVARNVFEIAKKTKNQQLEQGILRYDTFFDKIVFNKVKEMLGGNIKVLTTGGAPVTKEVKSFTRYAYGCALVEGYGQTECSAAGTLTLPWDTTYGNVGGPAPWAQVKLVDVKEKNYLAMKDEGEVCFRGTAVMTGYFQDPEMTKKAIDSDGWLHTGDIGRWLPNGSLQIIDRKNEMVKISQGDYVSPIQIESIYANSPLIKNVFVTGNPARSFLVGIVVLDIQKFKELPIVKEFEGKETIDKIMEKREVKDVVIEELNGYAKKNGLQMIELIRNVHISQEEFSEENGLLTITLKNRRKVLENHFGHEIEKMYTEIDSF